MSKNIEILKRIFTQKDYLKIELLKRFAFLFSDRKYLELLFPLRMGYKLNLDNPRTFSEKLQWLKLYDRRSEYTTMVDKYAVKEYVANIIGKEYIVPTIGVYDSVDEIDFDSLPDKFVLKCTHDSGGLVICRDKRQLNIKDTKKKLRKALRSNYYLLKREWPYKNVPRRIIAEQYIDPDSETRDLPDYKFFCFNGEPQYCQIITGRNTEMCIDFFDQNWCHQPFHEPKIYPFANPEPKKPEGYDVMWNLASQLAKDKAFSRIDFYNVNGTIYFGEITFYPTSGMGGFSPNHYDVKIGELLELPNSTPKCNAQ